MSFHFFFANKGDFLLDKMRSILAISTSRKLSSYASYSMRIRRESDDAELDVGFADNAIDKQAIKDFGGYNLLGYTEDLSNAIWNNFGSGTGNLQSGISDPFGGNGAYRFSTQGGIKVLAQNILQDVLIGDQFTGSLYYKNSTHSNNALIIMRSGGTGAGALESSVVSLQQNTTDWQRIDVTHSFQNNQIGIRFDIQILSGNSVDIFAPQLTKSSNLLPYQPRTAGGASDCLVTTLYDQSGQKNNPTQTVTTNQPKIYDVASSDLTKENGLPAMLFDGVDDILSNNLVVNQPNTFFVTGATKDSVASGYLFDGLNERQIVNYSPSLKTWRFFAGKNLTSSTSLNTNQNLFVTTFNGLNSFFSLNNNVIVSGDAGNNSLNGLQISSSTDQWNGVIQEMIIFDRNLTAKERTLLHSDINNHFNIY